LTLLVGHDCQEPRKGDAAHSFDFEGAHAKTAKSQSRESDNCHLFRSVSRKLLDRTAALVYHLTSTHEKEVVMQLSIEANNGIPIYEQLIRQVKFAVAEGVLMPGQLLPSVRELAKSLAINPNTVQRAYLELQSEEVIETLRGRGMAVCVGAKRRCVSDRQLLLGERLSAVVDEAIRSGLDPDRLREMFDKAIKQALRTEGITQ
jgi:GntR family transcriptional regulator